MSVPKDIIAPRILLQAISILVKEVLIITKLEVNHNLIVYLVNQESIVMQQVFCNQLVIA
jgi:hypothetical protein